MCEEDNEPDWTRFRRARRSISGRNIRTLKVEANKKKKKNGRKDRYPLCYSSQQRASTAEMAPSANSSNSLREFKNKARVSGVLSTAKSSSNLDQTE